MSTALLAPARESSHGDFRELKSTVLEPLAGRFASLNGADMEDIWQIAQIKVLDRQERGEEIENLPGLLWKVSFYEALSLLKFNNRRHALTDLSDHSNLESMVVGAHDATDKIAANELFETIRDVLSRLSERRRQFIVLRFVEEMPATQIASLYDVLVRTVHREVDKAIDAIATSVVKNWNVEGVDRKRVAELVAYSIDTLPDARRRELQAEFAANPALAGIAGELGIATRGAAATLPLPFIPLPGSGGGSVIERLLHLVSGGGRATELAAQGAAAGGTAVGGGLLATVGGKIAICIGGACIALIAIPVIKHKEIKRDHGLALAQKQSGQQAPVIPRALKTTLRSVTVARPSKHTRSGENKKPKQDETPKSAPTAPAVEPQATPPAQSQTPVAADPKPTPQPKPTGEFEVQ